MKTPLFVFLFLFLFLPATRADLTPAAPESIAERRIGRTLFEYTMRAKVTNSGAALAALSATVTSTSPTTTVVQGTVNFGNVPPAATAESVGTFIIAHDRTVPFDPAVLQWTFQQPFLVSSYTPQAGASEVGVTVRPQFFFSKPIDPATLNATNFYASFSGEKLPATIVPSNDCTFAWLFFTAPMPGASQVQLTVDGASIRLKGGTELLDAAGNGTPGSRLTFDFSTVSTAPVPATTLSGRIADPGPDLLPRTADDVSFGPDGLTYTFPIAGVKVYVIGQETNVAYTDVTGSFSLANMPVGNVKVVLDGRTATNPPAGYYFPEMVMDTTFTPATDNAVMFARDANGNIMRDANGVPVPARTMYLPRVASSILTPVTSSQPTTVTLRPEAALNLPPEQQQYLKVEVPAGSLLNNGQPVTNAQVGISVVPPELVRDMLPPGLLQHTFDITVQAPGITNFSTPAPMTFPNVFNAPPGTKLSFLSFDHTTGRLAIEGTATVSADGLSVHTDPATGITHPGWHSLTPAGTQTEIPGKPPECPGVNWDDARALAAAFGDCAADLLKSYNLLLELLQAVNEGYNLGTSLSTLESRYRSGAITLTDVLNALDALKATKDRLKATFDRLSQNNPVDKALAAADCLISLGYTILDRFCERKECLGPFVKFLCARVVPLIAFADHAIDKAEELTKSLREAPFTGVCLGFDALLATVRATLPSPGTIAVAAGTADPVVLAAFSNVLAKSQTFFEKTQLTLAVTTDAGSIGTEMNDLQNRSVIPLLLSFRGLRASYWRMVSGGIELRGTTSAGGDPRLPFIASNAPYIIQFYDVSLNGLITSSGNSAQSGSPTTLTEFQYVALDDALDSDGDGLADVAELVIGTDPTKWSTTGDSISDGAKVAQGLDPLSGIAFSTGVIANLSIAGEAKDVVLEGSKSSSAQQTAYVAAGSGGMAIVNAAQFQQPVLLSRLALPGDATDVSPDSNLQIAVVAANSGGLHFVNVSDPLNPALLRTLSVSVNQVEVVDGIAYAAVGPQLYSYDLLTGERLEVLSPGSDALTGLAREGSFLYSMDASRVLRAIDISGANMSAKGSLTMPVPAGGGKLFVGGGIACVAAQVGFATANVSDPNALALLSGVDATNVVGKTVVANGSGLAIAVGSPFGLGNLLEVLNFSDPTNTGAFITQFTLPADPYSVTIGSGIAFVADGTAGLQVVNYRSFDNQGVAPTVTVNTTGMDADATKPGIQVVEGSLVSVPVTTSDDVQVRNVELLVNGQVVQNDVTFPFDLKAAMPTLASGAATATVQVRATDTGGNIGLSTLLTVELVPDTTPPALLSVNPSNNSGHGVAFRTVTLRFSEPLETSTATAANIQLLGVSGAVAPQSIQFRNNGAIVQLTYPTLAVGSYQIVLLSTAIQDRAGNALGTANATSNFNIRQATTLWITNGDGDWDNAANWEGGNVPGPTDDVLIEVPADATITYRTGNTAIRSLFSTNRFVLSGGILNVATTLELNNTFEISGGTLVNATVVSGVGGVILSEGPADFDGVTLSSDLTVQDAAVLNVRNGLTLNNAKLMVMGNQNSTYVNFQGTQTLGGSGEVVFRLPAGIVTTGIGSDNDFCYSVALQGDGKIVVAGRSFNGSNDDFAVARYNANGSLDTSFDGTGKLTTPIGSGNDAGYSVAMQADGKILVAGSSWNGSNDDFAVVRYLPNGNLDTSFGVGGKVTTAIGPGEDISYGVALQSDGAIVACGHALTGSTYDFAVVRYDANGSLDTSFGGTGKLTSDINSNNDYGSGVALQTDGKIVLSGYSGTSEFTFALMRLNPNGGLDTTFNGNGQATATFGSGYDLCFSVAIQSDGKIVGSGQSGTGLPTDFGVVRFNGDGSLDTSFGGTGKVRTPIGSAIDAGKGVVVQGDGKIAVTGVSYTGNQYAFAQVRYNSNGSLDTSFGRTGKVTTPIGSSNDGSVGVALQGDGKIVAAGNSYNGSNFDFALARYNPNGTLDTSFNQDGNGDPIVAKSYLYAQGDNTQAGTAVLTIGPNITVHGSQGGTIAGYYEQDSIINRGTINADTAGKTITLNGATVTNQGTMHASEGTLSLSNFAPNAGVIRAGGSGTVAINGALEAGAGTVSIDLGGTAANQFGHLSVTGAATLSGTLNLNVVNGFSPAIGNTFPVLTFGSRTGQFAAINGLVIGNGHQFDPIYSATNLTLGVVAAPPAPAPLAIDTDGDGFTDAQEAIAGTDPRDAASSLRIGSIRTSGADVVLEFATVPTRSYAIECCTDLEQGVWTVIEAHIPGTGQPVLLLNEGAATRQPRCFYRLRVTFP